MRAQSLLSKGMVPEFNKLIQMATKECDEKCIQNIALEIKSWIELKLDCCKIKNKSKEFSIFLKGGLLVCEFANDGKATLFEKCIGIFSITNIFVTPKDLEKQEVKDRIFGEILSTDKFGETDLLPELYKLGDLFDLGQQQILEIYAKKLIAVKDYQNIYSVCQELCENYKANIVVKRILEILMRISDSDNNWEHVECTYLLSKTLLQTSEASEIEDNIVMFKKCDLMWNLIKASDLGTYKLQVGNRSGMGPKNDLFRHYYRETVLIGSGKQLFKGLDGLFSSVSQNTEWQNSKGKQKLKDIAGSGLDLAHQCFNNQSYQGTLSIINFVHECLLRTGEVCPQELIDLQSNSMKMMLNNAFMAEEIDFKFSLGCMLTYPRDQASINFKNAIANAGKNFSRLNSIARVGVSMGSIWNQRQFQVNCMDLAKHFRWLQEFQLLDIPVEESKLRSHNDTLYQESLIPSLMFKSGGDLELALLFAEEYKIPEDSVYKTYIHIELFQSHDAAKPNFAKLENIIKLVTNKEKLAQNLKEWYLCVSCYDYETLGFIAQQITTLTSDAVQFKRDILILEILGSFSRSQKPTKEEMERNQDPEIDLGFIVIPKNWKSAWSSSSLLRNTRLDFHYLKLNPLETLSCELNEENLIRLLPLIQILNVSADQFYEHIIGNKVNEMVDFINRSKTSPKQHFMSLSNGCQKSRILNWLLDLVSL